MRFYTAMQDAAEFPVQEGIREWVEVFELGRDGARYLAATHDMCIAALVILETGEPCMALGGFLGSDPILTV